MSETEATQPDDAKSLKRHGLIGLLIVVVLFGGLIIWASIAEIAGAVIAQGSVVVQGNAKSVQHRDGGIVKAIYARDEDGVQQGQLIAELESTEIEANLSIIQVRLRQSLVKEARLLAEIENSVEVNLPDTMIALQDDDDYASIIATERKVFATRKLARDGRLAQLEEQITQINKQIEGQELQKTSVEKQLNISTEELTKLEDLYARNLITSDRLTNIQRNAAIKEGELGQLIATIASAKAALAEKRLQQAQIKDDFLASVLDELKETRRLIAEGQQQERATQDQLNRTSVRAPNDGIVHQSVVHTIGGVIAPGETLMMLVPQHDDLLIQARINPIDIDKIFLNQDVNLRLSSFDQRTTPEITGAVIRIAPDSSIDQLTGEPFYNVHITISDGERARLPENVKLLPGMPVEAFVQTQKRTVMSYLLGPLIENLNKAFREE